MRIDYHAETDSLYIDLAEKAGVDSREVAPGVVLGLDDRGHLVGVQIEQASKVVDWSRLELGTLPLEEVAVAPMARSVSYDGNLVLPGIDMDTGGLLSDQLDDYSGAGQQEGAE
jgi:uncharacterized protein YuzE